MAPPLAMAEILIGDESTISLGKYGAPQSPKALQSEGTLTAANRTMGAVMEAAATDDTGPSETVSAATAGTLTLGMLMNVGNCAVSCTEELASATSYTA